MGILHRSGVAILGHLRQALALANKRPLLPLARKAVHRPLRFSHRPRQRNRHRADRAIGDAVERLDRAFTLRGAPVEAWRGWACAAKGAVLAPPAPPCKRVFSRGCVTRSESQAGANIPSQVLRRPVSGFGFLGLIPGPDRPLTDPAYQSAKSFPQDPLDTLAAIRDAQQAPHADQNLCPMLHVVEIRYGDDT